MKVLFERSAKHSPKCEQSISHHGSTGVTRVAYIPVTISAERAWQNGDVTETAFQRFICADMRSM